MSYRILCLLLFCQCGIKGSVIRNINIAENAICSISTGANCEKRWVFDRALSDRWKGTISDWIQIIFDRQYFIAWMVTLHKKKTDVNLRFSDGSEQKVTLPGGIYPANWDQSANTYIYVIEFYETFDENLNIAKGAGCLAEGPRGDFCRYMLDTDISDGTNLHFINQWVKIEFEDQYLISFIKLGRYFQSNDTSIYMGFSQGADQLVVLEKQAGNWYWEDIYIRPKMTQFLQMTFMWEIHSYDKIYAIEIYQEAQTEHSNMSYSTDQLTTTLMTSTVTKNQSVTETGDATLSYSVSTYTGTSTDATHSNKNSSEDSLGALYIAVIVGACVVILGIVAGLTVCVTIHLRNKSNSGQSAPRANEMNEEHVEQGSLYEELDEGTRENEYENDYEKPGYGYVEIIPDGKEPTAAYFNINSGLR